MKLDVGSVLEQNGRRYRVEKRDNRDDSVFLKEIPSLVMPRPKDQGRWVGLQPKSGLSLLCGVWILEASR